MSDDALRNRAPMISGTPRFEAQSERLYIFTPEAIDPDGDRLGFAINNQPVWADFDPSTGRLMGTPTDADIGATGKVTISVSDGQAGASLPSFSIVVNETIDPDPSLGLPPQISGTPQSVVSVNEIYFFRPTASDPDGDSLVFGIVNQPAWLGFDDSNGTLAGTPAQLHVGIHRDLLITVSDGTNTEVLGPFDIEVMGTANRSVTLTWQAPAVHEDGSPLTNLAGFKIRYGTQTGSYPNVIDVSNPGIMTYVVDGLSLGATYFFVTTAYTQQLVESGLSNEMSITLN